LARERKTASGTNKYLVGYYVPDEKGTAPTENAILEQLMKLLPEYMVPSALVKMDILPFTLNGKLDKRALPDPDFYESENYIVPGTDLEKKLCGIYSGVLGLDGTPISTHQNFFRMGGNSILCIQLKGRLKQLDEFKHISVADLFKYNSINKLIQSIQEDQPTAYKLSHKQTISGDHEIAIIGFSGAFSGAKNVEQYWQLIASQQEGIRFYSKEECDQLGIEEILWENPDYIPVEGKVEDIEFFDPFFWEMSPNEAKLLDPQIRKFLEHCWFALESSGYAPQRKQQNIGVFAGSGYSNYFHDNILHGELAGQVNTWEASIANSKDALATKTAFLLGLSGPANSINTACSTGLVAVIEACRHLMLGTCNMALAGGVSLSMPGQVGYIYEEGMILSKDGHCRTFDMESTGTTGGSGVGVILLKRLEDAIRDKDQIAGVIKGYATNNDGDRKTGYTAPSLIGQSECIINAQSMAGISSDQIDYVECHGTATHLGDPIEIQALGEAFKFNRSGKNISKHKTVLGAVKANIGHTDSAAGTAGLIKVICMLQHQLIPGQVNFREPNPELQMDQAGFEIITQNKAWAASRDTQRMAGVSSFGVGGTNAHLIVGDYFPVKNHKEEVVEVANGLTGQHLCAIKYIIPLSAKSRRSLEYYKMALKEYLVNAIEQKLPLRLTDIAYTLERRRAKFDIRSAYCISGIEELLSKLGAGDAFAETNTENLNKLVFMFPGQGAQYTQMAKNLYDNDRFFKSVIDQCITLANPYLPVDLFKVLYPTEGFSDYDINETQWTQISLFIIEYALAKYLAHTGVVATAFIGHSLGEFVAATLAGVFTLEDAIKIIIARGKLMQGMQAGSMLAINAGEDRVREMLQGYECEISVINSPEDVVVSGHDPNIQKLQAHLQKHDIPTVLINATVAAHSILMDQASLEFEKLMAGVSLHKPTKDFISNVTGELAGDEVTSPGYWRKHLRNTVQFAKGIDHLSKKYNYRVSFIEVGTGKGLCYFINRYKTINGYTSLQTIQLLPAAKELRKDADTTFPEMACLEDLKTLLWMNGILEKANSPELFVQAKLLTDLPNYQFDYQKCWLERGIGQEVKKFNSINEMFYERSWERARLKRSSSGMEKLKQDHNLVLINNAGSSKNEIEVLLEILQGHCINMSHAFHQTPDNSGATAGFDFGNPLDMETILREKSFNNPINRIIYVSPSIDLNNPALDIFAIRNIFSWLKDTGNEISTFISISFDNFDITGHENLQQKPSVIYGVTKSIPFEYFTSGTRAFHLDFSAGDPYYKKMILPALAQNEEKDFFAIRGKYQWFPNYQHLEGFFNIPIKAMNGLPSNSPVFLITGGLGGIGYGFADYLSQKEDRSTIILLGRSEEINLREDYKERLAGLRNTRHQVIYAALDIGNKHAADKLQNLLSVYHITKIEMVLHAAGISAKSALFEKTRDDIEQVIDPKIKGVENLVALALFVPVNKLVCCSSVTSIIPSLGNMEYTAANLYMDELCSRSHPGISHMLSINLNQVSDTGMAIDFIKSSTTNDGLSLNSIRSDEFPGIVEKLSDAENGNNIILSRYDFNGEYYQNTRLFEHLNDHLNRSDIAEIKITEENYSEKEYQIACIIGEALGIEEISLHDNFFRLGGNSILAIHVSHRLSKALNCDIFVADLFKHKTVSNLKSFLENKINNGTIIGQEIEI
jgi:acyl transferase domain-containing protein/NADP-dependent 3-hydroxy acid dehydrogenase YdfG/acyl carrier protein